MEVKDSMFEIDVKSREPIYEQLCRSITRMAALGAFDGEQRLPSVRALAQALGINPNTVQKAYQQLERDGVLYSVPGKGSFVADNREALERHRAEAVTHLTAAVLEAMDAGVQPADIRAAVEKALGGMET